MAKIKLAYYTLINEKVFIFLLHINFLFLYIGYITMSERNFHRDKRRINPCTELATFIYPTERKTTQNLNFSRMTLIFYSPTA